MEGHDSGVRDPADRPPDDPLVGPLLEDLRLPPAPDAPHLLGEDDVHVVALVDGLDPVHELRVVLELGELVVHDLERRGHVHRLLHRHPASCTRAVRSAPVAVAVAAGEPREQFARRAVS